MGYKIRAALGGGFGGTEFAEWEDCDATTEDQAKEMAYELACEEYDQYDGLHGLRSVEQIMEEDGLSEKEAEETWREERESWLEYEVREI